MELELRTVADTKAFGTRLAKMLRAGDLVILTGPLGAGKTALAQGIGTGLGVRGEVTSPTFVIARVHPPAAELGGRLPLVHVDAYRLGGALEVDDLDLDADLEDSVTVVEWGEGVVEQLASAYLTITVTPSASAAETDPSPRTVSVRGLGGDWSRRLAEFLASQAAATS